MSFSRTIKHRTSLELPFLVLDSDRRLFLTLFLAYLFSLHVARGGHVEPTQPPVHVVHTVGREVEALDFGVAGFECTEARRKNKQRPDLVVRFVKSVCLSVCLSGGRTINIASLNKSLITNLSAEKVKVYMKVSVHI